MTELQLELTRLLGDKTLSFGCYVRDMWGIEYRIHQPGQFLKGKDEIIGHPATLTDLHSWMDVRFETWRQGSGFISIGEGAFWTEYHAYKPLLDQSKETLSAILNLVKNHGN